MSSHSKKVRTFSKDERGNVAIIFGLTVLPAVLMIGGGIDFSAAFRQKQQLQAAADAAVLAAVGMPYGTSNSARQSMANNVFSANTSGMSVTPTTQASGNNVTLSVSKAVPTAFLGLVHVPTITVSGSARGNVVYTNTNQSSSTTTTTSNGKACILALDPSATIGIQAQGTPTVNYIGCKAHTNSTSATAISGSGSGAVVGAGHRAVGSISTSVFSPTPTGGAAAVADPFATVGAYAAAPAVYTPTFTPPTVNSSVPCKHTSLNLKQGAFTLDPGRYCGGMTFMAGATVTLNPGVYIIDNGIFNVQSSASVTGSNVLFYYHGAAARMQVIGGGTVNLRGRKNGNSYAGFLMIQHPDAWRGLDSNIQGGGSFTVEGMLYFPTQRLLVTGNGDASQNNNSKFFSMVAKSFRFQGNGVFNLKNYDAASNMPDLLPDLTVTTTVVTTTVAHEIEKVHLQAN